LFSSRTRTTIAGTRTQSVVCSAPKTVQQVYLCYIRYICIHIGTCSEPAYLNWVNCRRRCCSALLTFSIKSQHKCRRIKSEEELGDKGGESVSRRAPNEAKRPQGDPVNKGVVRWPGCRRSWQGRGPDPGSVISAGGIEHGQLVRAASFAARARVQGLWIWLSASQPASQLHCPHPHSRTWHRAGTGSNRSSSCSCIR